MVGKDTCLKQQLLHSVTPLKWPFQACHSFQVTERIYFFGLPSCRWLWCCLIKPLVITRCLVIAVLAVGAGFLQQRSVLKITTASDPLKIIGLSSPFCHTNAFSECIWLCNALPCYVASILFKRGMYCQEIRCLVVAGLLFWFRLSLHWVLLIFQDV